MPRQDLVRFAQLAYGTAQRLLPPYGSKFAPQKFTQPSWLACLCLKEYLQLDYRGLEALLAGAAELRTALALPAVPDHSTVWWFARHRVRPRLLLRMSRVTLRLFQQRARERRTVALEATGFSQRPASRYYVTRLGRWYQPYLQWSTVIWTRWQVICAQAVHRGPGSGSRLLPPLVAQTRLSLPVDRLLADADYDAEIHHRWLRETCGIERIIPARRGRPGRPTQQPSRRRMQRWFPHRRYGQRWLVETVYSVVKRKFGEALTARRPWQRVKPVFLRGVTYNLYRAVRVHLSQCHWWLHRVIRFSVT